MSLNCTWFTGGHIRFYLNVDGLWYRRHGRCVSDFLRAGTRWFFWWLSVQLFFVSLLYVDLILSMGPLVSFYDIQLFAKLFTDNSFGPHLASHCVVLYPNGVAFLQRRQTLSTMAVLLCLLVLTLLDLCTDLSWFRDATGLDAAPELWAVEFLQHCPNSG